jgi:hypothetical protein
MLLSEKEVQDQAGTGASPTPARLAGISSGVENPKE